jgi:hypothetical protein
MQCSKTNRPTLDSGVECAANLRMGTNNRKCDPEKPANLPALLRARTLVPDGSSELNHLIKMLRGTPFMFEQSMNPLELSDNMPLYVHSASSSRSVTSILDDARDSDT